VKPRLIILIHSPNPQVGKSSFISNNFTHRDLSSRYCRYSFAENLKLDASNFLSTYLHKFIDVEIFNKSKDKDNPNILLEINKTPREFLIYYSEFLKNTFGRDILLKKSIIDLEYLTRKYEAIFIDDWRLPIELEYVKNNFDNVITVYLEKDNSNSVAKGSIANTYENLIDKDICNIKFKFNEDWSNSNELVRILNNKIVNEYR